MTAAAPEESATWDAATELHRQLETLVKLGYPRLAGLDEDAFRALIEPLAASLDGVEIYDAPDRVPFVLVVTRGLVRPEDTVPLLHLAGSTKTGVVDRNHAEGDLAGYHPIPESRPPGTGAYLLLDVDRGEEFRNQKPEVALPVILGRGRSPLTIDEGIAVVTQAPRMLEKNKCFMVSGSRRHDRRVPALWISERAPKLGWCWDGNPHTWLGVASAAGRVNF